MNCTGFSFYYKMYMKASRFSYQSTYLDYRCKESQLFTYLVFYLNEKTCTKIAAHFTENFPEVYFQNSKVLPKPVFRIPEEYPSEKFSFQPETVVQRSSVKNVFLKFLAMQRQTPAL